MKTKSFILTLVALIAFAGNAWAQTWIGSEVSEGYALLYNVGTGKYLTRGNGWDTQASVGGEGSAMTVYLQLFDGKYKIRTLNSKGLELLDNAETVYTDQYFTMVGVARVNGFDNQAVKGVIPIPTSPLPHRHS